MRRSRCCTRDDGRRAGRGGWATSASSAWQRSPGRGSLVADKNPDALKLAGEIGADQTVLADGDHVVAVQDLTGGAQVVFDFVAEQGAEMDGWNMTAPDGSYYVIGYGGELRIPTLDIIATERNIVGNIVGTYTDLAELMVLAQAGKVTLHTQQYPSTGPSTPCTTWTPARCVAGRSSSPDPLPDPEFPHDAKRCSPCTRRMARSTSSSTATCTSGTPVRENWVEGREKYAKGWIDCFYGYHQLAPPKTHWTWDKYLKVSEDDLMRDVFEEGHVDKAIFQSTYLKYWYKRAQHRRAERLDDREAPDKFIVNGRWDPRDGDAGLKQLEEDARRWNLKGVKLYTAEWHENGSRGWKLTDTESYRFLEKCRARNHEHPRPQGPDDLAAEQGRVLDGGRRPGRHRLPDLNFIIEHAGIPRIDDFAYMAVQEPNVYAAARS